MWTCGNSEKAAQMNDIGKPSDTPEWIKTGAPAIELPSARDYIFSLDLPFDPDSQLLAIHSLLARNRNADDELVAEIKASEEHAKQLTGIWNDRAVEEWIELLHGSVYQDAAHSMSAVGMLAPFIEAVLSHCFAAIGAKCFASGSPPSRHDRRKSKLQRVWDCHYVLDAGRFRKDLVGGAKQLAEEIGLHKYLAAETWLTLRALYTYRNKMFHNGFEWPRRERKSFQAQWRAENWPPTWFSLAKSDGEPWVFYMTNEFIECCVDAANRILDAFGNLIQNDLLRQFR
jgi:hypothetical protein